MASRPPLLALTIHQPFAWAVSLGAKPVENRDWPPPPHVVGRYLAIHAGRQYDDAAARELTAAADTLGLPGPVPGAGKLTLGAVVAVARVVGAVLAEPVDEEDARLVVKEIRGGLTADRARELAASPWASGPYLWALEDVTAIEPVPCRGLQKIWTVPPPVAEFVRAGWKTARARSAA